MNLQGTGAAAVSQVVSSKSTVVQGGARGITHNNANGSSKTEVAMMDIPRCTNAQESRITHAGFIILVFSPRHAPMKWQ